MYKKYPVTNCLMFLNVFTIYFFNKEFFLFLNSLDDLLDKINSLIERRILKKCSTFFKGMQCIAPFQEDGRFVYFDILYALLIKVSDFLFTCIISCDFKMCIY